MKRVMIGVLLFILAVVSFTSLVSAQDPEMMKKWQAYMTPGKYHKHMAYYVGDWTFTGKGWENPKTPPTTMTGTVSAKMILGGRYLKMAYKGKMPMGLFEGVGITAFDNHLKIFHSFWIDTMGTGVFVAKGKPGTKKVREEVGVMESPMGKVKMRNVFTILSADKWKMEMFNTYPKAPEFKSMEAVYTRKK